MKRVSEIWQEVETAKAEARAIVEEGVRLQQRRSCDIFVDTDGVVYKRGDFPDALPSSQIPIHRECIWWASCDPNSKREWEAFYLSRMDRYELEKWLKKSRDKLHHVSVPLNRRANVNKKLITERVDLIDSVVKYGEKIDIPSAIKAIDEIMNHLRSIQKELKMQVDPKLTAFKK